MSCRKNSSARGVEDSPGLGYLEPEKLERRLLQKPGREVVVFWAHRYDRGDGEEIQETRLT